MNNHDDEKLIAQFLNDNAVKIEDDGFSRRVMHSLPRRATRLNQLWTAICAATFIIVAVKMHALALLLGLFSGLTAQIPADNALLTSPLFMLIALSLTASLAASAALFRVLR